MYNAQQKFFDYFQLCTAHKNIFLVEITLHKQKPDSPATY